MVATMARIPPKSVSADDKQVLEHLDADLKRVVFGQDLAIEKLASAIKLSRAGLRDPDKPIGNYLFSGPTGVGKTEVARQLASIMGIPLQRFDMSEYMERHAVSRLIGAPPGYVGYDQGGLLTDAVDQHPHSVLLLDEIEKAHPDLFNILLQVMDHGKLTDHHGKTVDFRNCILIMTTNAGASDMAREGIGFGASSREDVQEDAVKKMFTPEFRNRLDAIVPFSYLPPAVVARVVDKFILQLELQLADRNVHIDLDDEARAVADRPRLRQALRRAPDGPPRAGEDQAAARRGTAVRQAGQRRRGQGPHQGQCPGVRDRPGAAQGGEGQGGEAEGRQARREEEGRRDRSSGGVGLNRSKQGPGGNSRPFFVAFQVSVLGGKPTLVVVADCSWRVTRKLLQVSDRVQSYPTGEIALVAFAGIIIGWTVLRCSCAARDGLQQRASYRWCSLAVWWCFRRASMSTFSFVAHAIQEKRSWSIGWVFSTARVQLGCSSR